MKVLTGGSGTVLRDGEWILGKVSFRHRATEDTGPNTERASENWKSEIATPMRFLLLLLPFAAAFRLPPPPVKPLASVRAQSSGGNAVALLAAAALLSVAEPAAASDTAWIAPAKLVLGPTLTIGTIFFLMRVVLSWFPKYPLDQLPWSIVAAPTEPLLKPTRKVVPPVAGVDISPIIWVSILSFISEILIGPQGLLTIMQKRG